MARVRAKRTWVAVIVVVVAVAIALIVASMTQLQSSRGSHIGSELLRRRLDAVPVLDAGTAAGAAIGSELLRGRHEGPDGGSSSEVGSEQLRGRRDAGAERPADGGR